MQKGVFLFLMVLLNTMSWAQRTVLSGFNDSSAAEELRNEKSFDSFISRENIGAAIRDLSSVPHNLGSAGSKEVADKIEKKFRDYGFDVRKDVYQVLFPEPKVSILEMISPQPYHALLKEPALKEDGTSGQKDQL